MSTLSQKEWIGILVLYLGFLLLIGLAVNLSGDKQGEMTNVFATVTGVLLGLLSLSRSTERWDAAALLIISTIGSVVSSMISFDGRYPEAGRVVFQSVLLLFAISLFFFGKSLSEKSVVGAQHQK